MYITTFVGLPVPVYLTTLSLKSLHRFRCAWGVFVSSMTSGCESFESESRSSSLEDERSISWSTEKEASFAWYPACRPRPEVVASGESKSSNSDSSASELSWSFSSSELELASTSSSCRKKGGPEQVWRMWRCHLWQNQLWNHFYLVVFDMDALPAE